MTEGGGGGGGGGGGSVQGPYSLSLIHVQVVLVVNVRYNGAAT